MRRPWSIVVCSLVALGGMAVTQGGSGSAIGGASGPSVAHVPAIVPAGFADRLVASASSPTGVEVLPDGRLVVLEQGGRVLAGVPGAPLEVVGRIPGMCVGSERGLLGFVHDPGFLTNRHVYLYTTRTAPDAPGGCVNRVSRFDMPGAIDPASEVVLLDGISSINGNHNGGDLEIGSDGFLYVSTGDAGRDPRGQSGSGRANAAARDVSHLSGKILRITTSGAPAPGNPYLGTGTDRCAFRGAGPSTPTTTCQEIFASGLRNPYRIAFDPNTGADRFFINDVGQTTAEEVNEAGVGLDYGWNVCEGPCAPGTGGGLTDPIVWYPRSVGTFITAGAFVPDGVWPQSYDGAYLFADGGTGKIFVRWADGSVDLDSPWAQVAPGLADMTFGIDEAGRPTLYYTLNFGDEVRAITWTGATAAPTADGLVVQPVPPTRVHDTRTGIGVEAGRIRAGTTRLISVDPPSADVRAALVNLTMTGNAGWGFVQAWTPRSLRPSTSVINVVQPLEDVANTAVVMLDDHGRFLVQSTTATHLVVDVLGWFVDAPGPATSTVAAGRVEPIDPARVVDTRQPSGSSLSSGIPNPYRRSADGTSSRVDVTLAGRAGIPDDGSAAAAVVVLTAIGSAGPEQGFATAHPSGRVAPDASNVNTNGSGDIRANLAIVPLGADGGISVELVRVDDVLIDAVGYVTSASAPESSRGLFATVAPVRLFDERAPGAPSIPPGGSIDLAHAPRVPGAAAGGAVLQNLTITSTTGFDFVGASPAGRPVPEVSNVNATAPGQTRAALAITPYGSGGAVTYSQFGGSALIVDVVGVFSP